jgi:hypothetical protein
LASTATVTRFARIRSASTAPADGRWVHARLGHLAGAHAREDALVIEVGEFRRLVGSQRQAAGADEPERVPVGRAMAAAHRDAAERAGLADVQHQRRNRDDADVNRRAADAEETREGRVFQHLAGRSRVGADHDGASAAVGAERGGEAGHELRSERLANDAANARRPDLQRQGMRHRLTSLPALR